VKFIGLLSDGVKFITYFNTVPELWMIGDLPVHPLYTQISWTRKTLPLTFKFWEDSHGDHGLVSLVELRFKALPGTSYSYITIQLIGTT
jgi:hypothetical protein